MPSDRERVFCFKPLKNVLPTVKFAELVPWQLPRYIATGVRCPFFFFFYKRKKLAQTYFPNIWYKYMGKKQEQIQANAFCSLLENVSQAKAFLTAELVYICHFLNNTHSPSHSSWHQSSDDLLPFCVSPLLLLQNTHLPLQCRQPRQERQCFHSNSTTNVRVTSNLQHKEMPSPPSHMTNQMTSWPLD